MLQGAGVGRGLSGGEEGEGVLGRFEDKGRARAEALTSLSLPECPSVSQKQFGHS